MIVFQDRKVTNTSYFLQLCRVYQRTKIITMRWILLIKLNIRIYVPKYHLCELEEPGGLQSMELQRVRYHWASSQSFWGEETVPAKLRCSSKALELLMAGLPGLLILASLTRYTCENLESKICLRWLSGKESLPASSIPGLGGSHRAPEQLSSCATTTEPLL